MILEYLLKINLRNNFYHQWIKLILCQQRNDKEDSLSNEVLDDFLFKQNVDEKWW